VGIRSICVTVDDSWLTFEGYFSNSVDNKTSILAMLYILYNHQMSPHLEFPNFYRIM